MGELAYLTDKALVLKSGIRVESKHCFWDYKE